MVHVKIICVNNGVHVFVCGDEKVWFSALTSCPGQLHAMDDSACNWSLGREDQGDLILSSRVIGVLLFPCLSLDASSFFEKGVEDHHRPVPLSI